MQLYKFIYNDRVLEISSSRNLATYRVENIQQRKLNTPH